MNRTALTLALSLVSAFVLTACGGGMDQEQCPVYRAAYVTTLGADIPLSGPEHAHLSDEALTAVAEQAARAQGIDASRVELGLWADCE